MIGEPDVGGASHGETGAEVEKMGKDVPIASNMEVNGPLNLGENVLKGGANRRCFLFLTISFLSPYITLDRRHTSSHYSLSRGFSNILKRRIYVLIDKERTIYIEEKYNPSKIQQEAFNTTLVISPFLFYLFLLFF